MIMRDPISDLVAQSMVWVETEPGDSNRYYEELNGVRIVCSGPGVVFPEDCWKGLIGLGFPPYPKPKVDPRVKGKPWQG